MVRNLGQGICFWEALPYNISAGEVALYTGVGGILGTGMGGAMVGTQALVAYLGIGTMIGNQLSADGDPTNEVRSVANAFNRFTGMIYRNATGTPSSLTPRPGVDDLPGGGLSFFNSIDKLNPEKYIAIDASKLQRLTAILDNNPPGHVTVAPPTLVGLQEWAATRGTEVIHQFTQELIYLMNKGIK